MTDAVCTLATPPLRDLPSSLPEKAGQNTQAERALMRRLCDLFSHRSWGNLGPELYQNGGADLFTRILTGGDNGYKSHSGEKGLIELHKEGIASWAEGMDTAILVGPGPEVSVRHKEIPILRGLPNLRRIVVVELSPVFNRASCSVLHDEFPKAQVIPYHRDFMKLELEGSLSYGNALVISTGSLANYEKCPSHSFPSAQLTAHLEAFRKLAREGGKVLWGYHSRLDADHYRSDAVREFLLYPLVKASKIKGVEIDPSLFSYEPRICEQASAAFHDWVVVRQGNIKVGDKRFVVFQDERYGMFCSVKPDPEKVEPLGRNVRLPTWSTFREESGGVLHAFDCV